MPVEVISTMVDILVVGRAIIPVVKTVYTPISIFVTTVGVASIPMVEPVSKNSTVTQLMGLEVSPPLIDHIAQPAQILICNTFLQSQHSHCLAMKPVLHFHCTVPCNPSDE